MTIYAYRCNECRGEVDHEHRGDNLNEINIVCSCGGEYRRRFAVNMKPVLQEHFNPTVGKGVSDEKKFADDLKRASEKASLETGMEHRFEPVDPTDKKALGVTDKGIDDSNRIRRAQGLPVFKG